MKRSSKRTQNLPPEFSGAELPVTRRPRRIQEPDLDVIIEPVASAASAPCDLINFTSDLPPTSSDTTPQKQTTVSPVAAFSTPLLFPDSPLIPVISHSAPIPGPSRPFQYSPDIVLPQLPDSPEPHTRSHTAQVAQVLSNNYFPNLDYESDDSDCAFTPRKPGIFDSHRLKLAVLDALVKAKKIVTPKRLQKSPVTPYSPYLPVGPADAAINKRAAFQVPANTPTSSTQGNINKNLELDFETLLSPCGASLVTDTSSHTTTTIATTPVPSAPPLSSSNPSPALSSSTFLSSAISPLQPPAAFCIPTSPVSTKVSSPSTSPVPVITSTYSFLVPPTPHRFLPALPQLHPRPRLPPQPLLSHLLDTPPAPGTSGSTAFNSSAFSSLSQASAIPYTTPVPTSSAPGPERTPTIPPPRVPLHAFTRDTYLRYLPPHQVHALEQAYRVSPYLPSYRAEYLETAIGLSSFRIKHWFTKRRRRIQLACPCLHCSGTATTFL
ncbi:unnamed protein product [Orchesella dallaii]|uniref:Homeobox domain-containing protein n=1 Tax=Orchesella dallaii TaxID=48710 RepID=A0ABP1RV82_9HEXA